MNWPDGAALTAFGRQALSLVAQQLRTESVTCLLAPDYYCQTMLVPFLMEGIQVHVVVTGADCLMRGDALLAAVDSHPGCAILHCETFGNRPHADLAAALHDTAGRGIKLIIDRTHSWLDPATTPADYTVASLRKLLSVPDGAFVTGLRAPVALAANHETDEAVRARIRYLGDPDLRGLELAEDAIDDAWTPAPPSPQSLHIIDALDARALREQYLMTADRVRAALNERPVPGLNLINPASSCCVALSHPRAAAIMDDLAARGVYGPLYWGPPEHLPRTHHWRTDLFTVPVDRAWAGREELLASWIEQAAAGCSL